MHEVGIAVVFMRGVCVVHKNDAKTNARVVLLLCCCSKEHCVFQRVLFPKNALAQENREGGCATGDSSPCTHAMPVPIIPY